MKKINRIKTFLLMFVLLPVMLLFAGCGKNGLSAYEIALKNGFVGTEQEWLASLKGDAGEDGENGQNGTNATTPSYYDIFVEAKENGEISSECTYTEFLQSVLGSTATDLSVQINRALSSVVAVKCTNSSADTKSGSGVIYSIDANGNAIIITNYHVVHSPSIQPSNVYKTIKVSLFGETSKYTEVATFVGGSRSQDIAVLKLENCEFLKQAGATAAVINTDVPKIGESVFSVGNSKGYGLAANAGILSRNNDNVKMTIAGTTSSYRLYRHSSMTAGGNSGGGLFNSKGELIAITNGGDTSEKFINYAIPANRVVATVKNILATCNGQDAINGQNIDLGMTFMVSDTTLEFDHTIGTTTITEDVAISSNNTEISELSTLEIGDLVKEIKIQKTSVSDVNPEILTKTITRSFDVSEFLLNAILGDTITLKIFDGTSEQTITFVVESSHIAELA